jgi:hypothetical protein
MQSRDQINLEPWLCKAYVRARLGGIASFVKDGAAKLCRAKIGWRLSQGFACMRESNVWWS